MPRWKVGYEAWGRFYDRSLNNYTIELVGHVTAVGRDGFTIRRVKPDHTGSWVARYPYTAVGVWATREEGEAHIAAHPFSVGRVKKPGE